MDCCCHTNCDGDILMRSVQFSHDRKYRYSLTILWRDIGRPLNFIMLNPSTADEVKNDPTVERCERRARMWGFPGVIITNIFAYRSTNPKALYEVDDPVGPDNDNAIIKQAVMYASTDVVCAWGTHGQFMDRGYAVAEMLRAMGVRLMMLNLTASGQPCHPLYLPYDLMPQEWKRG